MDSICLDHGVQFKSQARTVQVNLQSSTPEPDRGTLMPHVRRGVYKFCLLAKSDESRRGGLHSRKPRCHVLMHNRQPAHICSCSAAAS